ncbi:hypothetical protein I4U23_015929 [Adineta vaga]|nr:hypothetical protein I4U23_015929 [Adineta vaga]
MSSTSSKGTIVTGRIETGTIEVNNEVEIVGIKRAQKATCTSIEMFHKRAIVEFYPGDDLTVVIKLTSPIAINNSLHFIIREHGRIIGVGVVTKVIA